MDPIVSELERLDKKVSEAEQSKARVEGQLSANRDQLEKEFSVTSTKEGDELLCTFQKEADLLEGQITEVLASIKEALGDS